MGAITTTTTSSSSSSSYYYYLFLSFKLAATSPERHIDQVVKNHVLVASGKFFANNRVDLRVCAARGVDPETAPLGLVHVLPLVVAVL